MNQITRIKTTFGIIVGIIIILFSIDCKKKCEKHFDVSEESKDYGYFLKGSYWVYLNDSTQQVDSFVTTSAITGTEVHTLVEEGCNPATYYGGYANSIAVSNIYHDSLKYSCGSSSVEFYKSGKFAGIYFTSAAQTTNDDSLWIVIGNIDLNGKNFSNVYESTYHVGANIYFAKNIGVIKTEILNDTSNYIESWSLLRYHILQ